jgi:hypothetical protein
MNTDSWVWRSLSLTSVGAPQRKIENWRFIGAPEMWLSILWNGLSAPIDPLIATGVIPWGKTVIRNTLQRRWMMQEVQRLLVTGAILPCGQDELKYCSSVFLVPKPGPKLFRMVVNMRPINVAWRSQENSFKMEGLRGFLQIIYVGAWVITWDLVEGFFHLMLDYWTSLFFGFEFERKFYRYRVCTFGWVKSMYFFNKLMAVFKQYLRRQFKLAVWSHVDDFACPQPSRALAAMARDNIVGPTLDFLGLIREPSKGHWDEPTQRPIIYGFEIDTVGVDGRGLVSIPDNKKEDLLIALHAIMEAEGSTVSARFVARIAGKTISVAEAFAPARPWSSEFFWAIDAKNRDPWTWDRKDIWVSAGMVVDADFLANALESHNGKLIWPGLAAVLLRWDASKTGWGGAVWDDPAQAVPVAQASGFWSPALAQRHINDLEPIAFLNVLIALEEFISGRVVQPQGDSTTANAAVSEFRGSVRSGLRNTIAKRAWLLAMHFNCTLLPVQYVNTADNTWADARSREVDLSDWELSSACWRLLEERWGPHSWDRFADMSNSKCTRFTARWFQPGCSWPDALTQSWGEENNYCCPPECLILLALNKVIESETVATFVIPDYPARWSSTLARIEIDRVEMPPVESAFVRGRSGHVEPWKPLGTNRSRRYVAVRVSAVSLA